MTATKKILKILFHVMTVFEFLFADMESILINRQYGYSMEIVVIVMIGITVGAAMSFIFALMDRWWLGVVFSAIMAGSYFLLGLGLNSAGDLSSVVFFEKNCHVVIPFVIAVVLAVWNTTSRRKAERAEYLSLKKRRAEEKSQKNGETANN